MTSFDSRSYNSPDLLELPVPRWPQSAALWMVVGWLALFIIRPWEVIFPWMQSLHFERMYVLITFGVILASGRFRILGSWQTGGVFTFIAALFMSSILGINSSNTADVMWRYVILAAFYIAVVSVVRSPLELFTLCFAFVAAYAAYLGKSEWEYFVHGRRSFAGGANIRRLLGIDTTFGSPNAVGASAAVSLLWLSLIWNQRSQLPWFTSTDRRLKMLNFGLAAYLLIALVAVVLTNSRAGMLAALLAMFLVGISGRTSKQKVNAVLLIFLVCLSAWLVMPTMHRERFRSIWDSTAGTEASQYSADARTRHFTEGWSIFTKFPLTGVGIDANKIYRQRTGDFGDTQELHNLYAKMLADTGIMGVCAFAFLLLPVFVNHNRLIRISSLNPDVDLRATLAASRTAMLTIVVMLFVGLSGNNLGRVQWMLATSVSLVSCNLAHDAVNSRYWSQEHDL